MSVSLLLGAILSLGGGWRSHPRPPRVEGPGPRNENILTPEEQRPGSCPPNLNTDTDRSLVRQAALYMSAGLGTSDISAATMLGWGWSLTPVSLASGVAVPDGVPVPE